MGWTIYSEAMENVVRFEVKEREKKTNTVENFFSLEPNRLRELNICHSLCICAWKLVRFHISSARRKTLYRQMDFAFIHHWSNFLYLLTISFRQNSISSGRCCSAALSVILYQAWIYFIYINSAAYLSFYSCHLFVTLNVLIIMISNERFYTRIWYTSFSKHNRMNIKIFKNNFLYGLIWEDIHTTTECKVCKRKKIRRHMQKFVNAFLRQEHWKVLFSQ